MYAEQAEPQVSTISPITYSFNKHLSPYYVLGLVPNTGDTIKDTTGLVPAFMESVVWEKQQTLNQKSRIGACYWGQVWKPGDKWGMTPLRPVWVPGKRPVNGWTKEGTLTGWAPVGCRERSGTWLES